MRKVLLFFSFMSVFGVAQPCFDQVEDELVELPLCFDFPSIQEGQERDSSGVVSSLTVGVGGEEDTKETVIAEEGSVKRKDLMVISVDESFGPTHANLKSKGLFTFWKKAPFLSDVDFFCGLLGLEGCRFNVTVELKKMDNDSLSSSQFTDDHLKLFLKKLSLCPRVGVLDLSDCEHITEAGFSGIETFPNLKRLTLSSKLKLKSFAFLEKFPNLEVLKISVCESSLVKDLFVVLKKLSKLTGLWLCGPDFLCYQDKENSHIARMMASLRAERKMLFMIGDLPEEDDEV